MGTSGSDSAATCPQTACFLPLPSGPAPGHGAQVKGAGGMGFSEKLIHTRFKFSGSLILCLTGAGRDPDDVPKPDALKFWFEIGVDWVGFR